MTDHRARFDAFLAAAIQGDAASGLHVSWMLTHMELKAQQPALEQAWEAALSGPWDLPARLAPAALAYLAMHPQVRRALDAADDAPALQAAASYLGGTRMFQQVVSLALVTSAEWQALFLRWRRLAMQRLHEGAQAVPEIVPGLAWVAVQANLAEYVWPLDAAAPDLAALRERVAGGNASRDEALVLACFEHPGPLARDAFDPSDAGQQLLLQRLYREPAEEDAIAASLSSMGAAALPEGAQRGQYERYPYPRWIRQPSVPSSIPAAARAQLKRPWWRWQRVLIAGCGTGQQCLAAHATYEGASLTAIDFSLASLAYAVRKCREAGLAGVAFEPADLRAYARRGARFDVVECIGVLHHLSDLEGGAAALRALTRRGGLLRLAVYSAQARRQVRAMREVIAARGLDGSLATLRQLRAELLAGRHGAMSPSMLQSPDLHSASGLHDLLFNACEHALGAVDWVSLIARHGFELVCIDPPAATLAAAGPAAGHWGPREWEAFERDHPDAFASMYEMWFRAA
ncbi:MAG TPA: class I SAM-dependent methyltransferase [Ramlibacter sp.]|uniref:class I SAM-dependent methyltransferase n=1 Tax=Ramlibacter sp. TaxID=1917967 RepID=UPI002CC0D4C7|nr:class I SAM-dependent methyltransferase [Ramlibacter sp.]HVZ43211.1 class I SAM-dependent methyltransferase [Ramlibacter sp.]